MNSNNNMSQLNHKTEVKGINILHCGELEDIFIFLKIFTENRTMHKSELKVCRMHKGTKRCRLGKKKIRIYRWM